MVSSSSPGESRSQRSTAFTAAVAFGTKARRSGAVCRKRASGPRASSSRPGSSRAKKRTGWRSMRSRSSLCACSTSRGQAPKEPWFKKVTAGSSAQRARSGSCIGRICATSAAATSAGLSHPIDRRASAL
ncbi:MAG: hypothetical protein A2138_16105 [Deltaproteobacteria bacterium RBG_16_71_12]|nr:MAG: hypothetical protein A2138_16105 [Deltaproteobacteria bacterium RBG_16_71_12]